MKKILVITITLSLLIFTSCKQINKWFGKSSMSENEVSTLILQKQELENRIKNDSINYEREMIALRMEYEQKLAIIEKSSQIPVKGFFVIVGSFKNSQLAENYANKIKSLGYEGNIVDGPNDFRCVTSGTFNTLAESLPVLRTARNVLTEEAWVYIK